MRIKRRNNKALLITALAVLIIIIVGLVVGIVLIPKKPQLTEKTDCSRLDDQNEQDACLREVYETDGEEVADVAYSKVAEEAVKEEKYYYYADTLNTRASLLVSDGKCDEAMNVLKNAQTDKLSESDLRYFYSYAKDLAKTCENEELANEFDAKYQAMGGDGEAEEVSNVEAVGEEGEAGNIEPVGEEN